MYLLEPSRDPLTLPRNPKAYCLGCIRSELLGLLLEEPLSVSLWVLGLLSLTTVPLSQRVAVVVAMCCPSGTVHTSPTFVLLREAHVETFPQKLSIRSVHVRNTLEQGLLHFSPQTSCSLCMNI